MTTRKLIDCPLGSVVLYNVAPYVVENVGDVRAVLRSTGWPEVRITTSPELRVLFVAESVAKVVHIAIDALDGAPPLG